MAKYALVTGASSGIGYNLAVELSKNGYTVFGGAPAPVVHLMDPLKEYGVIPFALDITDIQLIKDAVELFKKESGGERLDVLYNNAGIAIGGPGYDFDDAEVANFINVNLTGHIYMTKYFSDFVINAKGTILYTASVAAIMPLSWVSIYCATKAAINAYAKGIRAELAPFGVTVHSVITGGVETGIAGPSQKVLAAKVRQYKHYVPSMEASFAATGSMVKNTMTPDVYAKRVVKRIVRGFSGFNIYEGFRAGTLNFVSRWLPLWVHYKAMAVYFKQSAVFRELKRKFGE